MRQRCRYAAPVYIHACRHACRHALSMHLIRLESSCRGDGYKYPTFAKCHRHDRRRGRCEHRMLLYAQQPLRARHTMCNTRSQADHRLLELIVVEKTVVGVAVHVYRHAHRHANRHTFRRAPHDQWTSVIEAVAMSHRQLYTNIIDTLLAMSRQSCRTQGANPRHSTQGANCNKGAVGLPHPRRKLVQRA